MTVYWSAMELLLATRNPHKTREFAQLLARDFRVRDLTAELDVQTKLSSQTILASK